MFSSNKVVVGRIAVIAGIIVLAWPDALRVVIGVFVIIWGTLTWMAKK